MTTQNRLENTTWRLANYLDIAMSAAQVPTTTKREEVARLELELAILQCLNVVHEAAEELMSNVSKFAEHGTPTAIYVVRDALERYKNAPTPD